MATRPPAPDLLETDRTHLRRHTERGTFDRAEVEAILDEGYLAHVGFTIDSEPRVLPMAYGRIDDVLYLHGAAANAMLRAGIDAELCVTVTLLDGLVLARSAFHHSMNFRSVVLLGRGEKVTDPTEKARALDAVVDHVVAGRTAVLRPSTDAEIRQTLVLRLPILEGSAKVRTGGPIDEEADLDQPVWAGVVPLAMTAGDPRQDPAQTIEGLEPPAPTTLVRGRAAAR